MGQQPLHALGQAFRKISDLSHKLTDLSDGDVLFIDEIHAMPLALVLRDVFGTNAACAWCRRPARHLPFYGDRWLVCLDCGVRDLRVTLSEQHRPGYSVSPSPWCSG